MSDKRYRQRTAHGSPTCSLELREVMTELESPDPQVRAAAVRRLCPCRGEDWGTPVFPRVLELRDDPSPLVRHAVTHDLSENSWWNARQEERQLLGRQAVRDMRQARREIDRGNQDDDALPAPHSQAWRQQRRPRSHKRYYRPPGG